MLISMVRGCLLGYCLYVSAFLHLILAKRLRSDVSAFLKTGTNLKRNSILKTRKISSQTSCQNGAENFINKAIKGNH